MAALRRLTSNLTSKLSMGVISPSTFSAALISRRGIATKLFIGGVSFHTTEQGLSDAFSQHGQVVDAKIPMDRVTGKSKGFGFVTYASEDEAETAIQELNGKPLNGRVIFVDYAKPSTHSGGGMPIARGPPEHVSEQ